MASGTTKDRLQEDVKAALRAGNKTRLGVLRMVMAAIKQREVDGRKPLAEADVLGVLEKMVKMRQDAAAQFERTYLSALEQAERFTFAPNRLLLTFGDSRTLVFSAH